MEATKERTPGTTLTPEQERVFRTMAARYVWWKEPDKALKYPQQIAAQVMNLGEWDDVQIFANAVGDDYLRSVLKNAEARSVQRAVVVVLALQIASRKSGGRAAFAGKKAGVSRLQPRFDMLPPSQRALWSSLAGAPSLGMVLYGGTAIELRLGHRSSVDFDFFRSDDLPSRDVLTDTFPFLAQAKILQDERNSLTVLASPSGSNNDTVKLQFFGGITFGRVGTPQLTN